MAKRAYEMKLVVLVDDEHRQALIDAARRVYEVAGVVSPIEDDGTETDLPPEQAVESTTDALMELIQSHLEIEGGGVEVNEISCTCEENAREYVDQFSGTEEQKARALNGDVDQGDDPELEDDSGMEDQTDELDEFETGVYLCRWPNGDFSVVTASSRREAILALDEWGGAHPSYVHPIDSFMADFGLTDEGNIAFHTFGEETADIIWETCYPELREAIFGDDVVDDAGNVLPAAQERLREAVEHERKRLWDNQPTDQSATELGKRLAKQLGTSAVVADQYIKREARRILKSKLGEEGKAN
jgi:hypothetical protein